MGMVTVKADRLVLLYGGSRGQELFSDVWQYNLDSNMFNYLEIPERSEALDDINWKNCTRCENCERCDWKRFSRYDCGDCHFCLEHEESKD